MPRIGVMTGGGDSSAINAALAAIVKRADGYGMEVVGLRRGWAGLLEKEVVPLNLDALDEHVHAGGTHIFTSRTNLAQIEGGLEKAAANLWKLGLDFLIAIGGDDTLGVAHKLCALAAPAVGIPQTIDNDIGETDFSIGFATAVEVATEALRRLHTPNYSHQQDMLVELMGRDAGWIALYAGLAGDAHYLCVPEVPLDIDDLAAHMKARRDAGKPYTLVAVSEGITVGGKASAGEADAFGHAKPGGIVFNLAEAIQERSGVKPRAVALSYLVRGGPPSAWDTVLATRMGAYAVDLLRQGKFDQMVAARTGEIVAVPLERALARNRTVPVELYEVAQSLCKAI